MATTVTPPAGSFDAGDFIKKNNEREAAQRTGKQPEKKETPPATGQQQSTQHPDDDAAGRLPRSARRELNSLRTEVGRLQGQLEMLRELGPTAKPAETKTETKVEEDPQPQRKDFADDKQYERAMGRWEARQEAKKVLDKKDEQTTAQQRTEAFKAQVQAMQEKATTDIETYFSDWEDVKKAAEEEAEVEFVPNEHPQLMALLALSDVQAGLYYHFAKHPKELESLLSLTAKPEEQIKSFHRLEGRIDRLYYTDEKKAAQAGQGGKTAATGKDRSEPAKGKTSQARAAELPAPTESASAAGGSTPATDVKPILDNGKINPAWKALRNEREGQRR